MYRSLPGERKDKVGREREDIVLRKCGIFP